MPPKRKAAQAKTKAENAADSNGNHDAGKDAQKLAAEANTDNSPPKKAKIDKADAGDDSKQPANASKAKKERQPKSKADEELPDDEQKTPTPATALSTDAIEVKATASLSPIPEELNADGTVMESNKPSQEETSAKQDDAVKGKPKGRKHGAAKGKTPEAEATETEPEAEKLNRKAENKEAKKPEEEEIKLQPKEDEEQKEPKPATKQAAKGRGRAKTVETGTVEGRKAVEEPPNTEDPAALDQVPEMETAPAKKRAPARAKKSSPVDEQPAENTRSLRSRNKNETVVKNQELEPEIPEKKPRIAAKKDQPAKKEAKAEAAKLSTRGKESPSIEAPEEKVETDGGARRRKAAPKLTVEHCKK